jgi:hypothetical protein
MISLSEAGVFLVALRFSGPRGFGVASLRFLDEPYSSCYDGVGDECLKFNILVVFVPAVFPWPFRSGVALNQR